MPDTRSLTQEAIRSLMDDGLTLDDIAFTHGMSSVEGLREVLADVPTPARALPDSDHSEEVK